jgi:NADH:ubiquinone oxidoreductase subunit 4 (subunit M)
LTAVYSIWLYNRIIFNKLTTCYYSKFSDLSKKEFIIGFIFCFITILFGLKGSYIISLIEAPLYVYLNFK